MHIPLDPEEIETLRRKYGDFPIEHVTLRVGEAFFQRARTPIGKERRAEILAVVVAPSGRVLVHTKRFYPTGVYRLLSGGIGTGELVEEALQREIFEETGQRVKGACLIGVLRYTIEHGNTRVEFASYVYRVDVEDERVEVNDVEEEIDDFRWIWPVELREIREALLHVPEEWKDWGVFRALGHDFVLKYGNRCGLRV